LRKLRLKTGEDIEMGVERVRDVQIVLIAAKPAKRFAVRHHFQIGCIDVVVREDGAFFGAKITANHGHDAHVRKKAGRDGKMRGRTAQHALALTERCFNRIKGYRTDYKKRHKESRICEFRTVNLKAKSMTEHSYLLALGPPRVPSLASAWLRNELSG